MAYDYLQFFNYFNSSYNAYACYAYQAGTNSLVCSSKLVADYSGLVNISSSSVSSTFSCIVVNTSATRCSIALLASYVDFIRNSSEDFVTFFYQVFLLTWQDLLLFVFFALILLSVVKAIPSTH